MTLPDPVSSAFGIKNKGFILVCVLVLGPSLSPDTRTPGESSKLGSVGL